jgi:S1-C subfamily serine protease
MKTGGFFMKRIGLFVIFFLSVVLIGPGYADQPSDKTMKAEEILKAIVKIRSVVPKDAYTAGTLGTEREGNGVVIDTEGHILTIGYLIVEAETIEVIGPGEHPIPAKFVGYDYNTGFGLLRADKPLQVMPMKVGQSSIVKAGDPILIAGHGGKDSVLAAGVINRKEFAGYWEYLLEDAIYTAPAFPNFGGAALIGSEGQLLGIGSLLSQVVILGLGTIPCNIFVPIDLLNPILSDLKTKGRPQTPSSPWLGINVEEAHGRIFITRVVPEGPAGKGGIQPGDIILTVSGKPVKGVPDLYRNIWALGDAGVRVSLGVLQEVQVREITLRSIDRYQFLKLKPQKIL